MENKELYTEAELLSGVETIGALETEESTAQVERGDIRFAPENLEWSLPIMGKGMLGIFVVTSIIVGVTVILNKCTAPRNKEKKEKQSK